MGNTPNRAYPYPDASTPPDGPYAFQALADAVDGDVQDILYAPFGHMGKTNGFQSLATPAKVVFTQAQILRGGVTFDDAADALVLPVAGLYRLTCRALVSGGAAARNRFYLIKNGVVADPVAGVDMTFDKESSAADYAQSCSGSAIFAAGDKIAMYASSPAQTWGTSGWNGAFIEAEYVGPA